MNWEPVEEKFGGGHFTNTTPIQIGKFGDKDLYGQKITATVSTYSDASARRVWLYQLPLNYRCVEVIGTVSFTYPSFTFVANFGNSCLNGNGMVAQGSSAVYNNSGGNPNAVLIAYDGTKTATSVTFDVYIKFYEAS